MIRYGTASSMARLIVGGTRSIEHGTADYARLQLAGGEVAKAKIETEECVSNPPHLVFNPT